ncbi:MAG: EpsG family protein [Clostridia bacterium]|nr:EpsG family protein [Clostridia bacterium]
MKSQMMTYDILYTIFSIACIMLYIIFDKKTKKIQPIDIIMIVILIVVSGIRCNVGSDYYVYYSAYNDWLSKLDSIGDVIQSNNQFGLYVLGFILKNITEFPYALFWLIACMIYPCMIIYMRKKTNNPSIGFMCYTLLGFFAISNNILKQTMAMLMMVYAYESLVKNKKIKFVLATLLATTFHTTAIVVAILMILARKIKPSYKNLLLCILIGVVGFLAYNVIGNIVSHISILERYQTYFINTTTYSSMIKETIGVVGYAIIYIAIVTLLISKKEQIKENDEEAYKRISLLMVGIAISIFSINNWTINRIALYLYQFVITIMPALFAVKYSPKEKRNYMFMILILLVSACLFLTIFAAENEYYSYQTYFNTEPMPY